MFVTLLVAHDEISWLKAMADWNIPDMFVTLLVSQDDTLLLKDDAL